MRWNGCVKIALIGLFAVNPCFAGWFAEVQPLPRQVLNSSKTGTATLPSLIKIAGFQDEGDYELVIIDADPRVTRYGLILQVIDFSTNQDIQLLLGGPWPQDVSLPPSTLASTRSDDANNQLDLSGSRSLLLFNGFTDLRANSGLIQDYMDQLQDVELIDIITFGSKENITPFASETPILLLSEEVISRPLSQEYKPMDNTYLVSKSDEYGYMDEIYPIYSLNPGLLNQTWSPVQIPAPSTWMSILGFLGAYAVIQWRVRGSLSS
jgi:hypothetical protein